MGGKGKHAKYKRSVDEGDLNDKQELFVLEYVKDLDARRAGIAAGYESADSGGKLLANPTVCRQIGVELERLHRSKGITNELVLEQLYFALSRTSDDFIDQKTGMLVKDLRKLSTRAKNMVEGIKQKTRSWTDGDGEEHVEVETEIKFVSKQAAIDLAMRHKGLIEANKSNEVSVTINLNDFLIASTSQAPIDPIEDRIRQVENKADKVAKVTHKEESVPVKKKPLYTTKELIEE